MQSTSTSTANNVHTPKNTHYKLLHTCPYQFQFSRLGHQCVRMYICTHLPGRKTQMMNVFLILFFSIPSLFLLSILPLCNSFSECAIFFSFSFSFMFDSRPVHHIRFCLLDTFDASADLHIIFECWFHISWFIWMIRILNDNACYEQTKKPIPKRKFKYGEFENRIDWFH